MNIAILFNSGHPTLGSMYGFAVMRRILAANVLQTADRTMRVSIGDVLTYSAAASSPTATRAGLAALCRMVYQPKSLNCLIADRLDATHGNSTVFCWLFQNMTAELALALHEKLAHDKAYLGLMDVDFSTPGHLAFFRNSLCEEYRLRGSKCAVFYQMGENEDPDVAVKEILEEHGFTVEYEDVGARRTIFDNYDTLEHFARIEDFRRVFAQLEGLDESSASNLMLTLEELHPKLFDAFASAARALERAETEEDLAQAAISGRRLLEATADYLFPARDEKWKGREVGKASYRNRLWAYLEQTINEIGLSDPTRLQSLGEEADRLVALFNKGLHSSLTREKVESAFRDLVVWLTKVIELSPAHARRPYLAYENELDHFIRGLARE